MWRALLYLGGLISQLTIGYQKWLADGGMTGKATMGAIYFSPLVCWRSAMTGSGLKCTLFTAVLAGGLFVFVRLQNRFGSNDYDPRNFTRSKRGTYGTSGWMSEKEMRSVLEVAGPERAKGIILGKTERGLRHLSAGGHPAQQAHRRLRRQRHYEVQGRHPAGSVPEHPAAASR